MNLPADYVAAAHTHALHTLHQAERRWGARRRPEDELRDAALFLRAARAAWAAGAPEEAALWYRRSCDGLLVMASVVNSSTSGYAYYAETAVGASVLANSAAALERVAGTVRRFLPIQPVARRVVGRAALRRGDIAYAGKAIVCAWAAWLCGAEQDATMLLRMAEREKQTFTTDVAARWKLCRWPQLASALDALLRADTDAFITAVKALDQDRTGTFTPPDPATDLVDETLAILAATWRERFPERYDPSALRALVVPGLEEHDQVIASAGSVGRET